MEPLTLSMPSVMMTILKLCLFVGSDAAQLYMRGRPFVNNSKCAKANMGAKNYAVVMPDANVDATLNALVAAGFGAAEQRENKLAERAKVLKVTAGTEPGIADLGPVISKQVLS
ncbi:Methylmalonate-semialdehyde dehydrogenase [Datura stramonium]|uniref:Methylmalonate-semialdehyde dehydrogenase [acylating], mitochondrial n=1 Tax=Datura stramonium TaxID=4076 RepID=A0ABS8SEY5_DATST|nr:Methylmalonate-semialdehyde dehydrogenase [acylating], mitochondrial [Datura stramonium]